MFSDANTYAWLGRARTSNKCPERTPRGRKKSRCMHARGCTPCVPVVRGGRRSIFDGDEPLERNPTKVKAGSRQLSPGLTRFIEARGRGFPLVSSRQFALARSPLLRFSEKSAPSSAFIHKLLSSPCFLENLNSHLPVPLRNRALVFLSFARNSCSYHVSRRKLRLRLVPSEISAFCRVSLRDYTSTYLLPLRSTFVLSLRFAGKIELPSVPPWKSPFTFSFVGKRCSRFLSLEADTFSFLSSQDCLFSCPIGNPRFHLVVLFSEKFSSSEN